MCLVSEGMIVLCECFVGVPKIRGCRRQCEMPRAIKTRRVGGVLGERGSENLGESRAFSADEGGENLGESEAVSASVVRGSKDEDKREGTRGTRESRQGTANRKGGDFYSMYFRRKVQLKYKCVVVDVSASVNDLGRERRAESGSKDTE